MLLKMLNDAPFRSCIPKIYKTLIGNAEDLNIVMPMYNLFDYSDNYSMTSGSLRNYHRNGVSDSANERDHNDNMINNKSTTCKFFLYKNQNNTKNIK